MQILEVNECLNNPCHSNATCNDTLEYFTCTCNTGFTGNGLTCTGIKYAQNIQLIFLR